MKFDIPIASQIGKISKSLIGGLVLLAVFATVITFMMRSVFVEYRETARTSLTANAIFEDIFEARMAAAKWRLSPSQEQIDEVRANMDELRAAEEQIAEIGGENATLLVAFQNLSSDLSNYEEQFQLMLAARDRFDALEREIQGAGLAARQSLSKIMTTAYEDGDPVAAFYAGRAQESLMLGRYYLERYRRTEAEADVDRSLSEMQIAKGHLETLLKQLQNPQRRQWANSAIENLAKFKNLKPELMNYNANERAARQALDTIGPKIVADVETVVDAATQRENTLGPQGQATATWSTVIIILGASLIVIFGLFISRRLSARISDAIESSVETMSKIADGDLEAEVQHAEYKNEIGRMARALEVFKSNGKAAIEATQKERAAEEKRQKAEAETAQRQEEKDAASRLKAEEERQEMISSLSHSIGSVVSAASAGDFSKRVEVDFADQQLTMLAGNVNVLIENVDDGIAAAGKALERVAGGDLTQNMTGEFKGVFEDLQSNTNQMISNLRDLIGGISESTDNLSNSSAELRDTSDVLSKQAEQSAASLEETSAALDELSANIKQVDKNISDANGNAQIASDTAVQGRAVASDAAGAMTRIKDASVEISKVISVINEISFQINLLALNAGVEAARAGEAGRGFSVVASEVRSLAQRATEASGEIASVIAKSDTAVAEGVEKVADAEASLQKISASVVDVSDSIKEIAIAISQQVSGVSEINTAVTHIDQNTQKQAAAFEEVTAASAVLSDEAVELHKASRQFDIGSNVVPLKGVQADIESASMQAG